MVDNQADRDSFYDAARGVTFGVGIGLLVWGAILAVAVAWYFA